jgi:hypothetical protein
MDDIATALAFENRPEGEMGERLVVTPLCELPHGHAMGGALGQIEVDDIAEHVVRCLHIVKAI